MKIDWTESSTRRGAILEQLRAQLKTASGIMGCWIQRIGPRNAAFPHVTIYAESDSVETLTIHAPNHPFHPVNIR